VGGDSAPRNCSQRCGVRLRGELARRAPTAGGACEPPRATAADDMVVRLCDPIAPQAKYRLSVDSDVCPLNSISTSSDTPLSARHCREPLRRLRFSRGRFGATREARPALYCSGGGVPS
jgi:hypothetical protein